MPAKAETTVASSAPLTGVSTTVYCCAPPGYAARRPLPFASNSMMSPVLTFSVDS